MEKDKFLWVWIILSTLVTILFCSIAFSGTVSLNLFSIFNGALSNSTNITQVEGSYKLGLANLGSPWKQMNGGVIEMFGDWSGTLKTDANNITITSMTSNEKSFLQFPLSMTNTTDFTAEWDENISTTTSNVNAIICLHSADFTSVGTSWHTTGEGICHRPSDNTTNYIAEMELIKSGSATYFQPTPYINFNITYYMRLTRVGNTITLSCYSDPGRTSLVASASGTGNPGNTNYLYLALSGQGITGTRLLTGVIDNFYFDNGTTKISWGLNKYSTSGDTITYTTFNFGSPINAPYSNLRILSNTLSANTDIKFATTCNGGTESAWTNTIYSDPDITNKSYRHSGVGNFLCSTLGVRAQLNSNGQRYQEAGPILFLNAPISNSTGGSSTPCKKTLFGF